MRLSFLGTAEWSPDRGFCSKTAVRASLSIAASSKVRAQALLYHLERLKSASALKNVAIVIPETIGAIRAICGVTPDAARSTTMTDSTLGIGDLTAAPVVAWPHSVRQPTSTTQEI